MVGWPYNSRQATKLMSEFTDKLVLITGGSRGIGKGIAIEFARNGANIIINYLRNRRSALETQKAIEDLGVSCSTIKAHLGEVDKISGMFEEIKAEYGHLDILINNAASGVQREAERLEPKHWDWAMNINARAPWICSIEASKLMVNGGSIVNISSEGSRTVLPYYLSVGASKAALESLTRYLAVELSGKNINVNTVSGGYVMTDALDTFPNRDNMVSSGQQTLAGRMVTIEDLAKATLFLCSKDAIMIRGQVLTVDGGVTLMANKYGEYSV